MKNIINATIAWMLWLVLLALGWIIYITQNRIWSMHWKYQKPIWIYFVGKIHQPYHIDSDVGYQWKLDYSCFTVGKWSFVINFKKALKFCKNKFDAFYSDEMNPKQKLGLDYLSMQLNSFLK